MALQCIGAAEGTRGFAPYLAVVLAGAALFAAGVLVACTGPDAGPQDQRAANRAKAGGVLYSTGLVVAIVGIVAACIAADEGWCGDTDLQRFGLDD